jgi:hypothetical protein
MHGCYLEVAAAWNARILHAKLVSNLLGSCAVLLGTGNCLLVLSHLAGVHQPSKVVIIWINAKCCQPVPFATFNVRPDCKGRLKRFVPKAIGLKLDAIYPAVSKTAKIAS